MCSFIQILYVCIAIKFCMYMSYSIMLHTVLLLFCIKSEIVHMFVTVQGSAFHSHFTVKNVGKKNDF